jgi:hypothetical protein
VPEKPRRKLKMQRFINTSLTLILFGLVILWVGCSGPTTEPVSVGTTAEAPTRLGVGVSPETTNVNVPDWFLNIPQDPNYTYAVGTHYSKALDIAISGAQQMAREDISSQVEARVSALFKRFREEIGLGEDAQINALTSAVSKAVVSESLKGARTARQDMRKEGNLYHLYLLMELNSGEMKANALEQIKKEKNLYAQFRASQGFKELEAEVEKYENWKKEQEQG